jgi:hypothetical protein
MTDSIKREIERLLDEPGDQAATGQGAEQRTERLRSRLIATFSEGLGHAPVSSSEAAGRDLASLAAFLDGQLTGAERDKLVADLGQHQNFRADLESTAALVSATSESPLQVPKHLLARAGAQFAPAPAQAPHAGARWDAVAFFSSLFPQRRLALALVAALALMVAVPAGLLIRGPSGGGQPELSGVEEPVKDTSPRKDTSCEDKSQEDKSKADKSKADKSKDVAKADKSKSKDPSIDPCDHSTPGRDATKK